MYRRIEMVANRFTSYHWNILFENSSSTRNIYEIYLQLRLEIVNEEK